MILNNCKVKWAHVHQVDRRFTPRWTINVYLNAEQVNALRTDKVPLKNDDEGTYITATRNETRKDRTPNKPPRVVDMAKQPFTKEIGNGSVCNVIVTPFDYEFAGKKGVTVLLDAVQVVEWKEYVGEEDFGEPAQKPAVVGEDEMDPLPF